MSSKTNRWREPNKKCKSRPTLMLSIDFQISWKVFQWKSIVFSSNGARIIVYPYTKPNFDYNLMSSTKRNSKWIIDILEKLYKTSRIKHRKRSLWPWVRNFLDGSIIFEKKLENGFIKIKDFCFQETQGNKMTNSILGQYILKPCIW